MRTPRDTRFYPHTELGPGKEFDSIRRMIERWGPYARRIGDDAAVINSPGERCLVASTDVSVENVHFRAEWLAPDEIGFRAAASALSDLAAMGAKPVGMLTGIVLPEAWRSRLDAIVDGIGSAAKECNAPVLGGDMSRGKELAIAVTVLGTAREPLMRSGARDGDNVYITGRIGGAGAALTALLNGDRADSGHMKKFAHPMPRILEAQWLAECGAHAAIDISDGLSSDLGHIAAASRVKITIDLDAIPVVDGVSPIDAAGSGEEYEVVVASPIAIDPAEFARQFGIPLTRIGRVEKDTPGVTFVRDGKQVEVPRGYLHFE